MAAHFYDRLLNFCARTLKDRNAATDLVQDAHVRMLAAGQAGVEIANPEALLYRIARNLMIDRHRRAEVRDHQCLHDLPEDEHPHAPRHLQPEEIFAADQYAKAIHAAIDSLPPRCREAFILNRFEGLSHQQVALQMGISRNMVAQHVTRAVLVCKACDDAFHGRTTIKTTSPTPP